METVETRVLKSIWNGTEIAKLDRKRFEKSSLSHLGPGDRGFKSRSPDQNRQFSLRKPAVLTFLKRLFFVYSNSNVNLKKQLDYSPDLSYNLTNETASQTWLKSCRKLWEAVLTTFLTIDRFGTRGNSGEDRFGKHGVSE